jgi:hypothetical protein
MTDQDKKELAFIFKTAKEVAITITIIITIFFITLKIYQL